MTENVKQASWEGEFYRDMVTYRFIELSISALETAFEDDPDLTRNYAQWLDQTLKQAAETPDVSPKPIILYEFVPEPESEIQIFALPNEGEFFVRFKSEKFEVSVSMSYNAARMDVQAARIVMFTGDMTHALAWAEAMRATLDDMLVARVGQEG